MPLGPRRGGAAANVYAFFAFLAARSALSVSCSEQTCREVDSDVSDASYGMHSGASGAALLQHHHRRTHTHHSVDQPDTGEIFPDVPGEGCEAGRSCAAGGIPDSRGACVQPVSTGGTLPTECWDICNRAHDPEEYKTGDSEGQVKLAQAVLGVRAGNYPHMKCPESASVEANDNDLDTKKAAEVSDILDVMESVNNAEEAAEKARLLTSAAKRESAAVGDDPEGSMEAAEVMKLASAAEAEAAGKALAASEELKRLSENKEAAAVEAEEAEKADENAAEEAEKADDGEWAEAMEQVVAAPTPMIVTPTAGGTVESNNSAFNDSASEEFFLGSGCCFSFGYAEMMEPCCLSAGPVANRSVCLEQTNLTGGLTTFAYGRCPSTALEAEAVAMGAEVSEAASSAEPIMGDGANDMYGSGRFNDTGEKVKMETSDLGEKIRAVNASLAKAKLDADSKNKVADEKLASQANVEALAVAANREAKAAVEEVSKPMQEASADMMGSKPMQEVEDQCSSYMQTTGCQWTAQYNCPGQQIGSKSPAKNVATIGYDCCCGQELWKQQVQCSSYMQTTGCQWTAEYNCPGQQVGSKFPAKNDATIGYDCCCGQELWKQVRPEQEKLPVDCGSYMQTTGCQWTADYNCPGQQAGSKYPASDDTTIGYDCCCSQELWKQVSPNAQVDKPTPEKGGEEAGKKQTLADKAKFDAKVAAYQAKQASLNASNANLTVKRHVQWMRLVDYKLASEKTEKLKQEKTGFEAAIEQLKALENPTNASKAGTKGNLAAAHAVKKMELKEAKEMKTAYQNASKTAEAETRAAQVLVEKAEASAEEAKRDMEEARNALNEEGKAAADNATVRASDCDWAPVPGCVEEFTYKGQTYVGCTDTDQYVPWCSQDPEYVAGSGRFSNCMYSCEAPSADDLVKTTESPAGSSNTGKEPIFDDNDPIDPDNEPLDTDTIIKAGSLKDLNRWGRGTSWAQPANKSRSCVWQPADGCISDFFKYKGAMYKGCTTLDHENDEKAWCSMDAVYVGRWQSCTYICTEPDGDPVIASEKQTMDNNNNNNGLLEHKEKEEIIDDGKNLPERKEERIIADGINLPKQEEEMVTHRKHVW